MDDGPNVKAAYDEGKPYRPTVFDFSEILHAWGPRTSGDLDIPPSKGRPIVSPTTIPDCNTRIDMASWSGRRQRRVCGYVAEIPENSSENADALYRFYIISKPPYCEDARHPTSSRLTSPDLIS